ncbi:CotH kinase family protein [Candidatus Latescibacterota bacterium]
MAENLPLINEIMPSNSSCISDDDNDFPDWIEIYNQGELSIDITGYGLSDNPDNPFKWTFPAISIESGQYLLVFASGKDRNNTGQLHTNFKIDNDGETLLLTDPSGTVVDSLNTGALQTDISLGRKPDGGPEWYLFTEPTPGSANSTKGYTGYADSVSFSLPGGFYSGSLSIKLSTTSPTTEIHYTRDSSEPLDTSPLYENELLISKTTVVRMRAFETGKLPGPVNTATYILDDHPETEVSEYFITCNPEDFDYIYEHYSDDTYIPVTITYKGKLWSDVGMRIRGDDSRAFPKKSLKLKFSGELFEYNRDMLNFNAEYLDKSYISQYLSSRLMREAGQPAFQSEHARLYLNGEFLGLYLRIENVDEYFLEANNLDPGGNLYKATVTDACLSIYDTPDSVWEKKTNADSGIDDLVDFIGMINSVPDKDYLAFTHEYLDYDKMVNMVALNMLVANGSTYYHNYFMYQDIHGTNKWTMFPWDMDKSFGYRYTADHSYLRSTSGKRSDNPFHKRAIINETILNDIRTRVNEFSETIFDRDYLIAIIDSLQTALESSVLEDNTDDVNNIFEWYNEINDRKDFAENRIDNLVYQFENYPRPFSVEPTPAEVVATPTFVWHPSTDPNGDPLTYTLTYCNNTFFNYTTEIEGITDTTYTFSKELPPGTYYWKVRVSDGSDMVEWYDKSYLCEGFNHRNVFTLEYPSSLPSPINGEIVLSKTSSPYKLSGDTIISPGGSLTVEPGVELIMYEDANIYVRGTLNMNGTSADPITVQSISESSQWGALCFDNSEGVSTLSHVIISGATSGSDAAAFKAAVSGQSSHVVLENVQFENNLHCVYMNSGNLSVSNCIFTDTNSMQHIDVIGGTATVEHSQFFSPHEGDAVDYNGVRDGSVSNNLIVTSADDGIDIGDRSVNIIIANNRIYGCSDKGISIGEYSYGIDISRNIITNTSIGIAVKDSSTAVVDHNTLYNNDTSISAYNSTSTIPYGGVVNVTNSIISESITATLSTDDLSSITVSYSLSDKEIMDGTGNIYSTPFFNAPGSNDFSLKSHSPAIDTGSPESEPDGDGSRTDMGALPYSDGTLTIVINEINYNSSDDFNTEDWVELYNTGESSVDLTGWKIKDSHLDHTFVCPENTIIGANDYLVICREDSLFAVFYPELTNYIGGFEFGFDSDGELIRLLNSDDVIVDSLTYFDVDPWPDGCDGNGPTLALINPLISNNIPENWTSSAGHGTPGAVNDVYSHVGEDKQDNTPTAFSLGQNYPNPFNPVTTIPFDILKAGHVIIEVYSITGQRIATVVDDYLMSGNYTAVFNARNLSSGIYFYRISTGKNSITKQMVLIK